MTVDQLLADANAAMRSGQYEQATAKFLAAHDQGADGRQVASGLAECAFYLNRDEQVLYHAATLLESPHWASRGHILRGLVFRRAKRDSAARHEFESAARYGDLMATANLNAMARKRE